jgi:hypothetical protein
LPIERDYGTGTACGHIDEECFENELMTGFRAIAGVNMPISRITIGILEDLGYVVDYNAAGSYSCVCDRRLLRTRRRSINSTQSTSVARPPPSGEAIQGAMNYGIYSLLQRNDLSEQSGHPSAPCCVRISLSSFSSRWQRV